MKTTDHLAPRTPSPQRKANSLAAFSRTLLLLGFTLYVNTAHADVAYTTLAPDGTYNQGSGWQASGVNSYAGTYYSTACSFVPTISGNLSSIDMGVTLGTRLGPQSNGNFILSLATNNAGGGPLITSTLASGSLTATVGFGNTNSALTTFNYTGPTLSLSTGVTYWLVITPVDDYTYAVWNASTISTPSTLYYSTDGGNIYNDNGSAATAFRVNVGAVPEPSTYALLALGGATIFLTVRREKQTT